MKSQLLCLSLALIVPGSMYATPDKSDDPAALPRKRILFFSKSSGYEHSVIKDPSKPYTASSSGNAVPGLAFQVLKALGDRDNIEFVFSKDGSLFNPAYLAQFDAFFFFTTGDLTTAGTDGNPPMTPEGKAALLSAVAGGKGFLGAHCATDTFHTGGANLTEAVRYTDNSANADPYVRMIGGEFIRHGKQQPSHLIVVDPRFPGIIAVPEDNRITEEWYSLKSFAKDLHVLLVQDTSGMNGLPYERPNYPSTWARMYDKGRVFYTSLGHRDDVWESPMFQTVLAGAINWAVGRADADVSPNLDKVAPQANVLPVYREPAQGAPKQ